MQSKLAFETMSPARQQEMFENQRESWVRGEMGMGSDRNEAEYAKAILADDIETIKRLDAEAKRP